MRMNTTARITALLSIIGVTLLISVPLLSTAQDATPAMSEEEMVQRGASIYYTVCVACHQVDGNGVPGVYLPLNQGGLINLDDPEFETPIDLVPNKARPMKIDIAMTNSFGFGGTNASVIFKRVA